MKDFENTEWQAFIGKCEKQVESDNKEFGINSVFLPNPKICPNPKYCLIAMEPMDNDLDVLKFKKKQGYLNFIEGYEELILHYCAYHYLCDEKFDYYITDFSKGSMPYHDANKNRDKRWDRWQELLKEEMNLLGNPKLIAVGKKVYDFMDKTTLKADDCIQHYSSNNRSHISTEYGNINKETKELDPYCEIITEEKIEEFVFDKLIVHLNYKRIDAVKQVLNERWRLYAYYRHKFQSIKHQPTENKQ